MRELVEWTIHWTHELPEGVNAATVWEDHVVWLRHGLSQVERRCAIEHERHHVLRGPGREVQREERAVDIIAARALIRLDDLIDAARWARSVPELADELNVTQEMAHTRLYHLHPSERAALQAALEEDQEQAG